MNRNDVILKWTKILGEQKTVMSIEQVNEFCKDCTEANTSMSDVMLDIVYLKK